MSILSFNKYRFVFSIVSLSLSFSANALMYFEDSANFYFNDKRIVDKIANDGIKTITTRTITRKLNGFDSSLGELISVDLSFDTFWELQSRVWAKDKINDQGIDIAQGKSIARSILTIDLVDPDSRSPVRNFEKEVSNCKEKEDKKPVCTESSDRNGYFIESFQYLPELSILDFIDQDITFKLTRKLTVEAIKSTNWDNDSTVKAYNEFNSWSGWLDIKYGYKAFNVPEPSTLLLFVMGIFGMGFRRFRSFKRIG